MRKLNAQGLAVLSVLGLWKGWPPAADVQERCCGPRDDHQAKATPLPLPACALERALLCPHSQLAKFIFTYTAEKSYDGFALI